MPSNETARELDEVRRKIDEQQEVLKNLQALRKHLEAQLVEQLEAEGIVSVALDNGVTYGYQTKQSVKVEDYDAFRLHLGELQQDHMLTMNHNTLQSWAREYAEDHGGLPAGVVQAGEWKQVTRRKR